MKNFKSIAAGLFLAAASLGLTATSTLAAPITLPASLNSGDQYRLAFIASNRSLRALSSDITVYNDSVTATANSQALLAALGTTWSAIVSTPTVDARDNTNTLPTNAGGTNGVPIYLLNGAQLVSGYDSLWDGNIDTALNIDETGSVSSSFFAHTGTRSDGTSDPGLEVGSGTTLTTTGLINHSDNRWIAGNDSDSGDITRFYAISGILTAASPIPAPAPLGLLAFGLVVLVTTRRRRSL